MVEKVVVTDVDKKLARSRVGFHCAGHGNGAFEVGEAIICLVLDGSARFFLLHTGLKTTALDHEIADHAVEDRTVVVTVARILQKIGGTERRLGKIQLEDDVSMTRMQSNHAFPSIVY
jgi:hypothetical protein